MLQEGQDGSAPMSGVYRGATRVCLAEFYDSFA